LNQVLSSLIQRLTAGRYSIACRRNFLKQNNRLSKNSERSIKASGSICATLILSAFIPVLTYCPAAPGGTFVKPAAAGHHRPDHGLDSHQRPDHAGADAVPDAPAGSSIIGPSMLIAVLTIIVGYAAPWLADLAFKIDFRFWIVALELMSAKPFLIFLISLIPLTVVLRDRASRDALICGVFVTWYVVASTATQAAF
jgi:hypothetical protein